MFQDISHNDNLVAGDDFDYTFNPGSNQFEPIFAYADFSNSNGDTIFSCGNDTLSNFNTSITTYSGLSGVFDNTESSETNAQVTVNNAFTFSQLTTNVASNGITNASTVNLRANAGNSGVSVSIGGSSTGVFTDAVNTYTSATTDAMNYQIVTASTGTSMKLAFISVWGNLSIAAPATTYRGQSFRNIPVGACWTSDSNDNLWKRFAYIWMIK